MKEVFNYKYDDLFNPTLAALHNLGGSGSVEEIEEQVATILNLTDEQLCAILKDSANKEMSVNKNGQLSIELPVFLTKFETTFNWILKWKY